MTRIRKELPNVGYLCECFDYDHLEGKLFWKFRPRNHFKCEKLWLRFNNRFPGEVAGCLHKATGYWLIYLDGSQYYSHRVVWKISYGSEPPLIIDHINENRADNRLCNLQEVDRRINKIKSTKITSKSSYRGVSKRYGYERYEAKLNQSGKDVHIGYYTSKEEAAQAYNIALDLVGDKVSYRNIVDYPRDSVDTSKTFFITRGKSYHKN